MPKALPPHPHIDWLKKAAKERLAQLRANEPSAKLHQAQLDIAQDYGFASWRALKSHVDAVSLDGQIIAATREGRAKDLAKFLAAHPSKLAIVGDPYQRPLLHLAADEGRIACIDVLLRRGFDINTRDRFDNATALHWAAQSGRLDVVRSLVEAGADIDGEGDEHEVGVIGWASCLHVTWPEVAEYLLACGAKPNIFSAVALDRAALVRDLAARNVALVKTSRMSRFEHHRTALHLAVVKDRPKMVELLLTLGADPHVRDSRGHTPLNLATARTDKTIAARLIAAGAEPAEQGANHFEPATPIFNVKNVSAAIDYYVDKLGFEKEWTVGDPPTYACVVRGQARIFFCQNGQGAAGMWISIFVQDVDALYEDYKQRGAIIRQRPTNFPWGLREMNVQDLDGHRLRLGIVSSAPGDGIRLEEGE